LGFDLGFFIHGFGLCRSDAVVLEVRVREKGVVVCVPLALCVPVCVCVHPLATLYEEL